MTLRDWVRVFAETLAALLEVWILRHTREDTIILLPKTEQKEILAPADIIKIAQCIRLLVNMLFFWKLGDCCLYRCYAIACVLRSRGVPIVLNIGCRNIAGKQKALGHSWLTLHQKCFCEKRDPMALYPVLLGKNPEEVVVYWLGV